eukprot:TRINITY_DN56319_c0_g1_i1.p1 TRINITY_DN56319_c0_g1~~TRINITY_DN56319_c0_g1_i1.p1  ORF type:complete len:471 (-),score=119.14 TRINITY_DN56319_c0_g1_i1:79-1428(-)
MGDDEAAHGAEAEEYAPEDLEDELGRAAEQREEGGGELCDEDEEATSFCLRWDLNEDATAKLLSLSPDTRQLAMKTFNPPEHYKEVNGKFIAFANSLVWKQAPRRGDVAEPSEADLEAFQQRWALNEDAMGKLNRLSPGVRATVMETFNPPSHMTEVSGKFIAFAKSVETMQDTGKGSWAKGASAKGNGGGYGAWGSGKASGYGGYDGEPPARRATGPILRASSAADEFCRHWGLSADARNKLLALEPEVRRIVMDTFNPPPHMTEVSGKFIMFAVSVERSNGQGRGCGAWPPSSQGAWDSGSDGWSSERWPAPRAEPRISLRGGYHESSAAHAGMKRPLPAGGSPWASAPPVKRAAPGGGGGGGWGGGGGGGGGGGAPVSSHPMHGFVRQWGLNGDAVLKLTGLSPEVRDEVVRTFSPLGKPQECGWSGKFIAYASQVEKSMMRPGWS